MGPPHICGGPLRWGINMNYDAIVFDIDGTLWDARESVTQGWNAAIEEITGKPGTLDSVSFGALFGRPLDEIVDYVFPDAEQEEKPRLIDYCVKRENDYLMVYPGTLYPGVRETLAQLAQRYPLYIVSNCGVGYIDAMLQGTGLREYFQGWMCYADTNAPKDVTIRMLAERYQLQNPVYVGDIQADADACAKAGVDIIYAAYGLGKIKAPAATIHRFSDLLEIL